MNKILIAFLTIIMSVVLIGCGDENTLGNSNVTSKEKVTSENKVKTEPVNKTKEVSQKQESIEDKNTPKTVTADYKPRFGQILEAIKLGKKLTIKFKISPSYNNKTTIHQNGFNMEDLILNQGADKFDSIDYWAVADMQDGSESKVISFTLDKNLIDSIKNRNTVGNQIVDKAKDVWILPSLKN
ncbi:hypothetical protein G8S49_11065 [Clostridium botulinum C]|uniref:Lipoprotein n=2 Tax=Clostridium botulinum TaxID=1491 RepID=A0A9Q4TJD3_CLOBO|nr:hypothetical protein [Clostridium botulinum]EGO86270.1 hypothetical protein CBCST_22775 [Clostridium botulinum C str. Stockholm]MCD3195692.1 hypothetical protein [Clostridium botulinum C]MCD3201108.1 hypothetical protein [Clostridium botulinum C]MCD3206640.1 hypothetical protein [Clostridium botulinum C]MCD3209361.1 hypothetical protein [Clostridium botulinum C]